MPIDKIAIYENIDIEGFYQNSDKESSTLIIKCTGKLVKFRMKNKDIDNISIDLLEDLTKKECKK